MATISREDIESFVTSAEGKALSLAERVQLYQLLMLSRIEFHLESLASNSAEMPELETIAEKLSRIGSIIQDK